MTAQDTDLEKKWQQQVRLEAERVHESATLSSETEFEYAKRWGRADRLPGGRWPSAADDKKTTLPTPLHFQFTPHLGLAASPLSCRIITGRKRAPTEDGGSEMRVSGSTYPVGVWL